VSFLKYEGFLNVGIILSDHEATKEIYPVPFLAHNGIVKEKEEQ
jgi:hypothetical protein